MSYFGFEQKSTFKRKHAAYFISLWTYVITGISFLQFTILGNSKGLLFRNVIIAP